MDAILLVGGFGTRLHPLTKTLPKPLIPLANIPFVERTVHWLRDAGVDHIILSLHYGSEQFIRHLTQRAHGVEFSFALEDAPLGTGGAIHNCLTLLRSPGCFICNGDIFTNLDLSHMHAAHQAAGATVSIALKEVEDPSRYGVIETDTRCRVLSFTEKPPRASARSRDINAGVYIFERAAFDHFPGGACSVERDIFPRMLAQGVPIFGYQAWPYWTDLGTPEDYLQAHLDILARKVHVPLAYREITPGCWHGAHLTLAETALIRPPVIVGDGVTVAAGAVIGPAVVLGDHVTVEDDAVVERSVIWEDATIRHGSRVRGSILGRAADVSGDIIADICEDYAQRTG